MPIFLLKFLGFFKGLKLQHVLYAGAGLFLAFLVWQGTGFVKDKFEADKQVLILEQRVEDLDDAVRVMNEALAQRERATDTADAVRADTESKRTTYEALRRDAASATEEENGEVAPVLRRTLDALDGLR